MFKDQRNFIDDHEFKNHESECYVVFIGKVNALKKLNEGSLNDIKLLLQIYR